MSHDSDQLDELHLLAFQYVAEELADDARAAFEARLADDQAAREAVATVVEMTLAAREVFADDAALVTTRKQLEQPSGNRGLYRVVLACSALAALVLVSRSMDWAKPQPAPSGNEANDLAIAWSEARAAWPTALAEDESLPLDAALDDELALPTWMVAAVSAGNTQMTEQPPGDDIPE